MVLSGFGIPFGLWAFQKSIHFNKAKHSVHVYTEAVITRIPKIRNVKLSVWIKVQLDTATTVATCQYLFFFVLIFLLNSHLCTFLIFVIWTYSLPFLVQKKWKDLTFSIFVLNTCFYCWVLLEETWKFAVRIYQNMVETTDTGFQTDTHYRCRNVRQDCYKQQRQTVKRRKEEKYGFQPNIEK